MTASNLDAHAKLRRRYLRFAEHEARGISPLYDELARHVANSTPLLDFLTQLPVEKQQPNLLFGAVRLVSGVASSGSHFERLVLRDTSQITRTMRNRRTQTNEPARCAVLLPALARLEGPLALLEVGASAGLCLLPDRYGYDYGRGRVLTAATANAPVFPCDVNEATPVPNQLPRVVWRAGIDLNPLDLTDPGAERWLEALVWPEQTERLARLKRAIQVVRTAPPRIVAGDLLRLLQPVAEQAPRDATLVVFHSAVLGYVSGAAARDQFRRQVQDTGATWISNEHPRVFPSIANALPRPAPDNQFVLAVNGEPVAFTGPHGQSVEWLE